jgi:sulfoxide reductase heme-binding subunit YedZ
LGGRAWNRLHKLVYATGVIAALHYWWLVKADVSRPLRYGAVVLVLLGARAYWARRSAAVSSRPSALNRKPIAESR